MKKIIIFLLCIINISIFSQDMTFKELLEKMNVEFIMPKNYKEVPFVDQHDVKYDIGIKHNTEDVEVRVSLFPYQQNDSKKEKSEDDDKINQSMMSLIIILNISQDENVNPKISSFKDEDVKKEYGGDSGFTCVFEGNSGFSGDYKYVMINALYKKEAGTIYIFFLFNDKEKLFKMKDFAGAFYCVRFK